MPDFYFNPYSGAATNHDSGKECILATAKALESIKQHHLAFHNPESDTPVSQFKLIRDSKTGIEFKITDILHEFEGQDRELVRLFLSKFSTGQVLSDQSLEECNGLILHEFEVDAPVLEYAFLKNGIAATIATEDEWQTNFINFKEQEGDNHLPNVWGQSDLTTIHNWISNWTSENLDHSRQLELNHGITICERAMRLYEPAPSDWDTIFNMIEKAKTAAFEHDDYQIKNIAQINSKPMKQLKHRGSGLRIYIFPQKEDLYLGGFYKKSAGKTEKEQDSAIKMAAKNIKTHLKKRK